MRSSNGPRRNGPVGTRVLYGERTECVPIPQYFRAIQVRHQELVGRKARWKVVTQRLGSRSPNPSRDTGGSGGSRSLSLGSHLSLPNPINYIAVLNEGPLRPFTVLHGQFNRLIVHATLSYHLLQAIACPILLDA